jgi:LmbE family N-acetylglucosaminyl deacetylase
VAHTGGREIHIACGTYGEKRDTYSVWHTRGEERYIQLVVHTGRREIHIACGTYGEKGDTYSVWHKRGEERYIQLVVHTGRREIHIACAHTGGREIRVACGTYGEKGDTYSVLVGKPEGSRPLARSRRRWRNNIKIDLPEILSEVLTVINLAHDRPNCWLF